MTRSLLTLLPLLAIAAQPAGFREAEVTHLAFSPDGKALTAAYFRHAINRSGTDWSSFAVTWDVATGRATPLPGAIGPVAYSPDGKVLVTGLAERNRQGAFRNRPYVQVALWTPGNAEPTVVTAPSDPGLGAAGRTSDKGSVMAFAFHPGAGRLTVASADQLWWLPVGGKGEPVDELQLAAAWGRDTTRMAFDFGGRQLRLVGPMGGGQGRMTAVAWKVEVPDGKVVVTQVSRELVKDEPVGKRVVTAVSPDEAMKATVSGEVVTVEDAKTGRKLRELRPVR
ncbi:MAG TPA: hypothetical protein VH092_04340 [Urbifossiella sp.]|jgi:hypothetical protein|nr:hypothetical protein [Urbifossiella sp.]